MFDKMKVIIKDKFLQKEFLLFICIGVVNTFNGTLFSTLYSFFLNSNIAFVFGYISSLGIAYVLNSRITFHEKLSWEKFFRFFVSYIPNFLIQNIVVFIFYNLLGWYHIIVYALAAVIGIPVTFMLLKFFTFGRKENE